MPAPGDSRDLGSTESLCPECLDRIPARRVGRGVDVHLEKTCPSHGSFRTILWRGPPDWSDWAPPRPPPTRAPSPAAGARGCPFDCGLCPDHRVPTCCALLEVTHRCDLGCPYCFAASGGSSKDPDRTSLERSFRSLVREGEAPANIQLSGGEPTVRDDLPEIIELGRSLGFRFFQLNTNGLRLARDPAYLRRLVQAGLCCVFLQYDGVTDEVHQRIRGARLREAKEAAISRCAEAGVGVVLVPTLVPGVNVAELGAIVDRAVRGGPALRGIHIQPVSYFGRYPFPPRDSDRVTLPEVIRALEEQTHGMVRASDLRPPAAEHHRCSFSGNFVRTGGNGLSARPPSRGGTGSCCGGSAEDAGRRGEVKRAQAFVARRWAHPEPDPGRSSCCARGPEETLDAVIAEATASAFCISAMAFQDVWNVDLERVRECFLHVVSPDFRIIPFCAFNATAGGGSPLHRRCPP